MNVEIYTIASYRREADGTGDSIYVETFKSDVNVLTVMS